MMIQHVACRSAFIGFLTFLPMTVLTFSIPPRQVLPPRGIPMRAFPTTSRLAAVKKSNMTQQIEYPLNISFGIENTELLACDMFAILIASQLMGLLDVVNSVGFVGNGGWFQPIPAVPSTLGNLVEKITVLGALWLPLSAVQVRYVGETEDENSELSGGLEIVLVRIIMFSILRIVIGFAMASTPSDDIDWFYILRDCYFLGLALVSFRFLYRRYLG